MMMRFRKGINKKMETIFTNKIKEKITESEMVGAGNKVMKKVVRDFSWTANFDLPEDDGDS